MIRPFTSLSNAQLKELVITLCQDENWGMDLTQRVIARNYAKRIGEYKEPASYLNLCKLILEEAAYRWVEQNMSSKELLDGKELTYKCKECKDKGWLQFPGEPCRKCN